MSTECSAISLLIPQTPGRNLLRRRGDTKSISAETMSAGEWPSDAVALVDAIPDAMIGLTSDGVVRSLNPAAHKLFGCLPAHVLGKRLSTLADPAYQAELENVILERSKGIGSGPVESLFLLQDGTRVAVEATLIITRYPDGRVILLAAIVRDISARKQAEENATLIMEELNHRIRNALATVHSIVGQSLRGAASLDDFKIAINGRLTALAATHDLVTRSDRDGATLSELIHSELTPYGDAKVARWGMSGPKLSLEPKPALAIGMLIHELATNAAKYGGLSTPDGHVDVRWTTREIEGRQRLILEWREGGGPPVTTPSRRGFGTRLITEALAQGLNGKIALFFNRDGVRCEVDVPVDL